MAEPFPPNPEDGELWLPSNIFPDVGLRHVTRPPFTAAALQPEELTRVDELVKQLSALEFLEQHIHFLQRHDFFEASPYGRHENPLYTSAGTSRQFPCFYYKIAAPYPVGCELDRDSARVWHCRRLPRRLFTAPASGGCLGRVNAGTGVFLPRVGCYGETDQATGERTVAKSKPLTSKSAGPTAHLRPSPEMGLPVEWNY